MQVTVRPQAEELIRQMIASGRYADSSAIVRKAMLLLDAYEQIADLRAAEKIECGEAVAFTPEEIVRMRDEAMHLVHEERKTASDFRP